MQKLIDGLKEELLIYDKILELTVAEKEAFSKSESERFMAILTERLDLMNKISECENKLKPLREEWMAGRENLPDEHNKTVVDLVTKIKEKMDKILEIENYVMQEKAKQDKGVTGVPKSKAINSYKNM